MPSSPEETTLPNLAVRGTLPAALSGQYLRVGAGIIRSLCLTEGRAPSYRARSITTDTTDLISFGGSILAFGDGALASALGKGLDTMGRVDLAGAGRSLTAHPVVDPATGELHLLTFPTDPAQLHVRVSPGGLTRTIRSIDNAPNRIRQLALARDCVVLLADGFVGVTDRAGSDARATWFAIDTEARNIATVDAQGDTVVVYTAGPSLERWTLHRRGTTARCEVLDATPQTFAGSGLRPQGSPRFLWTVGPGAVHRHDLLTGARRSHDFGGGRRPGGLVFVDDPEAVTTDGGGWLVGFVHDDARHRTDFVVLDAQVIARPAVAVVHIPRRMPDGTRATWIPSAQI